MAKKHIVALLGASLIALASIPAGAQDLKVAYFDLQRLLTSSAASEQATERLNKEHQRRQMDVDAITKRYKQRIEQYQASAPTMTETERLEQQRELAEIEREMARRDSETREEMNLRRNEEVILLQNKAAQILRKIAEDEHYDLIIQDAFYASSKIDITDRVIKELDKGVKPAAK